jgi:hypothetical protein
LAPHAVRARTLTVATVYQFQLLCQNVVLERELAAKPDERGRSSHRGVMQRLDAQLLRFCLSPIGKPLVEDRPAPAADPFAAFDDVVN